MGVSGVAWPSMIARTFSAVLITYLCFRTSHVRYHKEYVFRWNWRLQKNMLAIAVPNAAESGVFQFVKVALSSMISMFGTYQIAANGIAQSFWSLAALVGVAMGPVFVTLIGQCMGAGDTDAADYYFKKLLKITIGFSVLWEVMILAATPFVLKFYSISPETRQLIFWLVLIHNLFNALALRLLW